ncbi:thiolase active site [Trichococcus palustris]|uniref:acetyl-CoA C-acetyltransferase n=1 Tax=Trichococcus palustris TaxID=140314 RepID=A0A143YP24_9LACT|nr:acetyl-CoA C-acetyltransferase [Trichococcus palustris]CZQ93932.1 thiolase active site [Trichococcus palustris]SFK82720.1 acetyl-CoA C-acetyltransferase [Trichococcus palustris]
MEEVVIVSAARTPIGSFGGSLKDSSAVVLGSMAVQAALQRANLSLNDIDSVIFGNVLQAGLGQNPARQIAIQSGIPFEVPAMTVNEVCGSGMKAIILGSQAIRVGDAETVVVGGTENMSQAPYLLNNQRWGSKLGDVRTIDSLVHDGLTDAFDQTHMGVTAETVAEKFGVTREEQDAFALHSQQKAAAAQAAGHFKDEIVPVSIWDRKKQETLAAEDEYIRKNVTAESLRKLKPAFMKDGTVTAGNASGINDGAAALVLMAKSVAEAQNIPYLATLKGYAEVGIDPAIMGYAPYHSIKKVLANLDLSVDDIDLYELNEAFASQSIAVARDLGLPEEKININGGAIALGHPIGASGSRILVTLLYAMERTDKKIGLASLCVGGGIGISLVVERP